MAAVRGWRSCRAACGAETAFQIVHESRQQQYNHFNSLTGSHGSHPERGVHELFGIVLVGRCCARARLTFSSHFDKTLSGWIGHKSEGG